MTWRGTEDIADDLMLNEAERADKNIKRLLVDIHQAEFVLSTLPVAEQGQEPLYFDQSYVWKARHAMMDWKRMSEHYIALGRKRIKQESEAIELLGSKIT